jgi:hypothetical protein
MLKKIIKSGILLIMFCILLEIFFKGLFPEFAKNHIHRDVDSERTISKSINAWYAKFNSITTNMFYRYHNKTSEYYINKSKESFNNSKNIYVFGDSVTGGFGVALQDTYFYVAEDLIKKNFDSKINVFSISGFGHNFSYIERGIKRLDKIIKDDDIIIYQFNYNDISPAHYDISNDISKKEIRPEPSQLKIYFNDFRKGYLNYSTTLRVLQHYAGKIKWNLGKIETLKNIIFHQRIFKKCGSLGYSTLGQYTFAYGAKNYQQESNKLWIKFENDLIKLNNYLKSKNLKFAVLISPISLQVSHHDEINSRNLSFKCSTIDAASKINKILDDNNIDIIDPLFDFNKYSKILYQNNNKNYLFHPHDSNHPNKIGHSIMGKKMYTYLLDILKL